jgi:ABC-2 type transport system ATP-binding protein
VIGEAKRDGATVVLNSHQLDEMERVCDRVAFLERGTVQRIESLTAAPPSRAWRLVVAGGREGDAATALRAVGFAAVPLADGTVQVETPGDDVERIAPVLVGRGIALRELSPQRARLEALFFSERAVGGGHV